MRKSLLIKALKLKINSTESKQISFDVSDIASNNQTKIQASLNLEIISDLIETLQQNMVA